jgi:hypothetical protein
MVKMLESLARSWYYFRIGYSTYLTFLLGVVNTVVVVWYLAIAQVPDIRNIFGHVGPFAAMVVVLGVPLSIGFGWLHTKRSPAYSSEVNISIEANPYYYKLTQSGYDRKVLVPTYLEILSLMRRLLNAQGIQPKDTAKVDDLERQLRTLIEGGYVGTPKKHGL